MKGSEHDTLGAEGLRSLARSLGLTPAPEHLVGLVQAFREQIASFDELDGLDLQNVEPITTFDPRWHE